VNFGETANVESVPLGERIAEDAIRFERVLRAPIERVWRALTTPEGLAPWLGAATLELRTGGSFTLQLGQSEMRGRILRLEPPARLVLFWQEIQDGAVAQYGVTPDFHSELSFELEPLPAGTKLTLIHRLIEKGDVMASFLGGWHAHLDALSATLEGGSSPDITVLYEQVKPSYEALVRI
jgi:uncharacterized protein YndB with AHSA1/START domain